MKKSRLEILLIIVLSLGLLGSVASQAAELGVPEDFQSIQAALDAASSGDTILVAQGTYEENITITKDNITLKATGESEFTVLKGTVNIEAAFGTVIDGLTITGPGHGISVRGDCRGDGPTLTVKNSLITGNGKNGIDFSQDVIYQGVTISNCKIGKNGSNGVNLAGTGEDISILNNNISNNGVLEATGSGVKIGGDVQGVEIADNTMVGNAFANIHPQSS
ncbi:right-handed parallel beta-helix repeat-containing protein [Candidatus Bipolaricaulota bacterium]|nr:right-handed parallel beta-helix repeat-containing protein [Candidatus Bipolaricaulota bacterium]MBS3793015.1 right-handed parallel beta-helix repeat-containing protein [Candidatus Bipolaricaulota bacterium]